MLNKNVESTIEIESLNYPGQENKSDTAPRRKVENALERDS